MKNIHLTLLTSVWVLFSSAAFSQSDTLLRFFNSAYSEVPEAEAIHRSLCITEKSPEGYWTVRDYFLETGKIMMRSYFEDSLLKVRTGPFELFDKEGHRIQKGSWNGNKKIGVWKKWHNNGRLMDSAVFDNNGNIRGIRLEWHADGQLSDSSFYGDNGKGIKISWYPSGIKRSEGELQNETRNGNWKFYQRSGVLASDAVYQRDSLLSIHCFDEKGNAFTKDCVDEVDAEFPGGIEAWQKYIFRKIRANQEELLKKGASGRIVVQFIIDTTGKIIEPKIVNPTGTYLDEFALETIRYAPRWKPARQHNILVKAYRRQPFTFEFTDE